MRTLNARAQGVFFTLAITLASRFFVLRDWLTGRLRNLTLPAEGQLLHHTFASGPNQLDAVLVLPSEVLPAGKSPSTQAATPVLLICHGIGEVVENWRNVQLLLAEEGIVSLVFDYSGYGRSSGWVTPEHCEQDAIAAFRLLQEHFPGHAISVLGFSLGTGIAAAVLSQLPIHRLVLCAAYTSFRDAAWSAGLPRFLRFLAPAIWPTQDLLRNCTAPLLFLHGEADTLFPASMVLDMAQAAGRNARMAVIQDLCHDDPYCHPQRAYWQMVSAHICG